MSRCGRTIDLLSDWRDHPRDCKAEHGWKDGYDGPCTDDAWDIAEGINRIDPFFHSDEVARLRAAFQADMTLETYDYLSQSPQGRDVLKNLPPAPAPKGST